MPRPPTWSKTASTPTAIASEIMATLLDAYTALPSESSTTPFDLPAN